MIKKLLVLLLVTLISLFYLGVSYGDEDYVYFTGVSASDNDGNPGVGQVSASIENGVIVCSLLNAYPGYEAYISFTIENTNETSAAVVSDISISNSAELDVVVTGITEGDTIPALGTVSGQLTVTVLPTASMNSNYVFGVSFTFNPVFS